jgi:hypothetical protein
MALTRIQKTFVRLAAVQRFGTFGSYRTSRSFRKKFPVKKVKIEIIDAVTGQKTTGKAFENSTIKLKKWLKQRNVRAEFTEVLLKKNSTWLKLEDMEFIDYPIIVKVGTYKAPYLVKRMESKRTFKGKTTCTLQLETVENVDYLAILSEKKELLAKKKSK